MKGFNSIFLNRNYKDGNNIYGGIAFYIRNTHTYNHITSTSQSCEHILLDLNINNKMFFLISVYFFS